jgi:hypothetical protein
MIRAQRSRCAEAVRQGLELLLDEVMILLAERVVDPGTLAPAVDDPGRAEDAELRGSLESVIATEWGVADGDARTRRV